MRSIYGKMTTMKNTQLLSMLLLFLFNQHTFPEITPGYAGYQTGLPMNNLWRLMAQDFFTQAGCHSCHPNMNVKAACLGGSVG